MAKNCSRCGSVIPEGHAICPTCGTRVPKSSRYVRCSHCLRRADAGLTVCPHCGRELKAWRADKTVLVVSTLLLLAAWLLFGSGLHSLATAGKSLVHLLPPRITPAVAVGEVATASTPTPVLSPTVVLPTATPLPQPTENPTQAPTPEPATPTPEPTQAPASTPTPEADIATEAPEATATTAATDTPEPTATATATNTPTSTATSTPTLTPTAKPQSDVYVVKKGDTLSGIATKVHRSIAALAAYNKITDPTTIRVGQELKIPPENYVPPTATPRRPTKTPTPLPTATPSITLPAPVIIDPGDNSSASGPDARIIFQWRQLPTGLPAGADYVVHIGVITGPGPQVDWRLAEPSHGATTYQVPGWLFGLAPQEFGRGYVWYIQAGIISGSGDALKIIPISQPSEKRTFYWN